MASAGDVNGDGYSDVIAGTPLYDKGHEGVAFVWMGKADGIKAITNLKLEKDKPEALFGLSVAGAGDVNGEGYSDITIGASQLTKTPYQGAAFLYYGNSSGILSGAIAKEILPSDKKQISTHSTAILASGAGDLNGDGFGDIIFGSYQYKYGASELTWGTALVYYGSRTGSIKNNLRLYNSNLTTIINQSQKAKTALEQDCMQNLFWEAARAS